MTGDVPTGSSSMLELSAMTWRRGRREKPDRKDDRRGHWTGESGKMVSGYLDTGPEGIHAQ